MDKPTVWLDGWHAHKSGVDGDANPFDEFVQPRSHYLWNSGWCARFSAVKHEADLSEDDRLFEE